MWYYYPINIVNIKFLSFNFFSKTTQCLLSREANFIYTSTSWQTGLALINRVCIWSLDEHKFDIYGVLFGCRQQVYKQDF